MNKLNLVLLFLISLIASGCATNTIDKNRLNAFHDARPTSILVVPPMNEVTDVEATTSVLATLPYFLGEKGFYVFPVNTVKTLLEYEGYYEPAEVHSAPPEQLANLFKADAILYVTIHEWTAKYMILETTTEVDLSYKLVGAEGAIIWEDRTKGTYSSQLGNGDLIINSIAAAIERGSPTYIPLTKVVHSTTLISPFQSLKYSEPLAYSVGPGYSEAEEDLGIPPGPYHPEYHKYYQRIAEENGTDETAE